MTNTFPALVFFWLASCATQQDNPVVDLVDPTIFDNIEAELSTGDWEIKHSLPELRYAKSHRPYFGGNSETHELQSTDGQGFQVLVLNAPSMSMPGTDFALAYLKNPDGKIVHWKSRWLSVRRGNLGTRLLDVNDDGVKEFCFVCKKRFGDSEQILAAYSVSNSSLDPVIMENTSWFRVEFQETMHDESIVIEPQLKGKYIWESDKLYEVPVHVTNRGDSKKTLGNVIVSLLENDTPASCTYRMLEKQELAPGESLETIVTMIFSPGVGDRKYKFELEKIGE